MVKAALRGRRQGPALDALERIEAQASDRLAEIAGLAFGPPQFPERVHLGARLRLHVEQEQATRRWARWAREQVLGWPDTTDPGGRDADLRPVRS